MNKLGTDLEMPATVTHVLVQAKQAKDPRFAEKFETINDANISKIYNGELNMLTNLNGTLIFRKHHFICFDRIETK